MSIRINQASNVINTAGTTSRLEKGFVVRAVYARPRAYNDSASAD